MTAIVLLFTVLAACVSCYRVGLYVGKRLTISKCPECQKWEAAQDEAKNLVENCESPTWTRI